MTSGYGGSNLNKKIRSVLVAVIALLVLTGINFSNISQLHNSIETEAAHIRLMMHKTGMVQIGVHPEKYILKGSNGYNRFIQLMHSRGWTIKMRTAGTLVFAAGKNEITADTFSFANGYFRFVVLPDSTFSSVTPKQQEITLVAAGDILMHNTQIYSGLQSDGTYNFESFFMPVKKLLEDGDYCCTNLEAALAGPASGYTGYPTFNSPDALAATLKRAGFDLVVTANNHCLDRGFKGGVRTVEVLHQAGLDTVGTYASLADSRTILIKNIKGIKVAYLAYTYGTNGIPVPSGHSYYVNLLQPDRVISDIKTVRRYADIVVLVLHWGEEYNPQATDAQKKMARLFFKAGADVILGNHPHVIEPMEVVRVNGKDKFVIYSLGNFIGHQRGLERNSGVILKIKVVKDFHKNKTLLKEVSYIPTFSHSYKDGGRLQFRTVPVMETIAKIREGKEPYLGKAYIPVLKAVLAGTVKQLGPENLVLNRNK